MERITKLRAQLLLGLFVIVLVFFAFKLYDLQVIQTGGKTDNTTTFTTRTRVKASRGDILDTNGNLLVGNRASYDLVINHYVLLTASGTNNYLYELVNRCQEVGIQYNENFPISLERPFVYTLDEYNSAWQSYFQKYLHNKELDSDITAPLLIKRLRERYKIPADWSEEDARAVIGLRYEMDLRGYVGSLPNHIFLSDVSDEHLSTLVELNIPGLMVEKTTVREYNTKYAAHVLGFVGKMNAEQWEKYKKIDGYSMDSEIGQSGLEAAFEEYLHGVDGYRIDTVTTSGELVKSEWEVEPKAGANVEVSIDVRLQRAAEEGLDAVITALRAAEGEDGDDAEGGAVVAVDVKTGQVLTCASYPTYDLSTYFENYEEILETDYDPLYNRALLGIYPPGSTYKMSMVVAGVDSGQITSETLITDKGRFTKYAPGFVVNCLKWTNQRGTHGAINAAVALQVSCNYFFYELGDRINISAMDKTAKALGLGESTGIELPENIGHRANEETKRKLYPGDDGRFYTADRITAAIGQSDNRFTPMQLAVYTAALANRGTRYKATFLNRVVSADYRSLLLQSEKEVLSTLEISDDAWNAYHTGMRLVTLRADNRSGTAYSTFKNYTIAIAAKTGTAQNGQNDASDNGAFVCYAPADDPQIAIAIYGEKAGHGNTLGTIARDMLDIYFEVGEVGDVVVNENKFS